MPESHRSKIPLNKKQIQAAVFLALVAFGLFLVARLVFAGPPRPAAALPVPDADAAAPEAPSETPSADNDDSLEPPTQLWKQLRTTRGMSPEEAFTLAPDYFVPDPNAKITRSDLVPEKSDPADKSLPNRTDALITKIEEIRAQAHALILQSTYLGKPSTAIINSQIVRTGDTIMGFRVQEIHGQKVVLEKEGIITAVELVK
jgi:hypothetical protein